MEEKYIPQEILLIKNGELALKGLNRRTFEDALMSNLRYRLRHAGERVGAVLRKDVREPHLFCGPSHSILC